MASQEEIQAHIERLRRDKTVALEQVTLLHQWLDRKRSSRQCGRVTGESRTGKTKACKAYIQLHGQPIISGRTPIVPVGYVYPKPDCTSREFYRAVLDYYNFDLPKGTVGDVASKTLEVIQASKTEILIVDEADRLKPNTLRDVRDIFDKLRIAVILVGTPKRLDRAIRDDEQIEYRFMPRYRVGTISSKELEKVVAVW
ncbi:MAG: TniB family NTP-binding protein [Leptolyngbyaceae cyanobacterium]